MTTTRTWAAPGPVDDANGWGVWFDIPDTLDPTRLDPPARTMGYDEARIFAEQLDELVDHKGGFWLILEVKPKHSQWLFHTHATSTTETLPNGNLLVAVRSATHLDPPAACVYLMWVWRMAHHHDVVNIDICMSLLEYEVEWERRTP